ncbi:MAG: magnesium transporter CorA family protein [Lachnospiraceae bacterium]|nr:magnesium transporter CorA family protein [Lachnospiraceae bacterium]
MVFYYMSEGQKLLSLDAPQDGCWISMIHPTEEEIQSVSSKFSIDANDLRSALDTDERSRIEAETNYMMILVNIPTIEDDTEKELYDTIPLSLFVVGKSLITVCSEETPVLQPFLQGKIKDFNTNMRSRFVMQILYRNASLYLQYLRNIERQSDMVENKMHKSTQNSELFELLKLEKSLVYFTTALRSNEVVMEKLFKSERFKKYPEDAELLEDVIIENKQAIEMAGIYSGIIASMTDAFASVISNNLNNVMKTLAIITIVLSIPTMIFSAYGMNVATAGMPFADSPFGFIMIVVASLILSLLVTIVFIKMKMFK